MGVFSEGIVALLLNIQVLRRSSYALMIHVHNIKEKEINRPLVNSEYVQKHRCY